MTKQDLINKLENQIKENHQEIENINTLLALDLSRFNGKRITKHLDTAIRKSGLSLYTNYSDGSKASFQININRNEPPFYNYINIYIRMSDDYLLRNTFNYEQYKKVLNDYISTRTKEIDACQKDLDRIDTIIELTNKLHDQIGEFKELICHRTKEEIGIYGLDLYKFRKIN